MSENSINLDPVVRSVSKFIDAMSSAAGRLPRLSVGSNVCSDVCPPKHECPPSCILKISRSAMAGERIIVPFKIGNRHNNVRFYRIGVYPILDDEGKETIEQPQLNVTKLTLQPGQSRLILMQLDLKTFKTGHTYKTDIVIREDKFNQNICFTLCVLDMCGIPTAYPWDERSVYRKWLGWQRHFMCPPVERKSEYVHDDIKDDLRIQSLEA